MDKVQSLILVVTVYQILPVSVAIVYEAELCIELNRSPAVSV